MAGLPPLAGYLGHEAYLDTFWNAARHGPGAGEEWVLAALVAGSALTATYAVRYLWGAFASRPGTEPTPQEDPGDRALGMAVPIAALVAATLGLGMWYPGTEALTEPYAALLPSPQEPYHLALWHGLSPALLLSAAALAHRPPAVPPAPGPVRGARQVPPAPPTRRAATGRRSAASTGRPRG
ncbi:hypothetical protein LUW77_26445 [Streptomyces radiopugnans]|nr:hypothetical protein LUW77_26445 [Streptomyces radiopugnans]